ncbi:hypothetical protein ILUMI_08112 [Ignelater luminosus]|uniref:Uncharacterized protein n=1 Tax=Ignelater luminosus TaxID=2038154 RepID=A0A8K0D520_IGNLU|nr:hypothetical protein ILUMI_08112 [Ignelater luminosus]
MVTRRSLSDCSNSSASEVNEDVQDTISIATATDSEEEETNTNKNELVLAEDLNRERPSFGNIAVTNSTDVHFGNKTYYQGPVTIKQFLYANPQVTNSDVSDSGGEHRLAIKDDNLVLDSVPDNLGKDNPTFIPDASGIKIQNDIDKKIINGSAHHTEETTKGTRWLQNFSRQHLIVIVSLAAVLLISLVTLMIVLLTRHQPSNIGNNNGTYNNPSLESDEGQSSLPSTYPVDPNVTFVLPNKLKIVTRKEWLAQPPTEPATPLKSPVPNVIIMHTATENCSDIGTCTFHVRYIQSFHIDSRGWWDIGYNWLVGGDGYAYEGRGWTSQGANVYGYNANSIGIAFIGTFNQIMPPERQITAAKQLIEIGVIKGYIAKDYKLLAARQLQATQSPGLLLYEDVKKWPHWSSTP